MLIEIHVERQRAGDFGMQRAAGPYDDHGYCVWAGDPGWLSLPAEGSTWFHCGEWGGEIVDRVSWNGPGYGGDNPAHCITVRTTQEVIAHLIAEHGFQPPAPASVAT